MKATVYLLSVFILISGISCRSKFNKIEYLSEYENLAIYRLEASKYPSSKNLKEQIPPNVEFPELTADQIIAVLGNFEFIRDSYWGRVRRPVFYEQELEYLAPLVSHHLQYLGDKYRLVLVSRYDPDKSVLSRMERVSVVIWMNEEGLNVVFGEIRSEIPHNDMYTDDDVWKEVYPVSLKRGFYDLSLVDADFFTKKLINGRVHETWAIIPQDKISTLKYTPSSEPDAAKPSAGDITEKLKSLQKAKEEGLLSEEEYQEKRKKLIDSY